MPFTPPPIPDIFTVLIFAAIFANVVILVLLIMAAVRQSRREDRHEGTIALQRRRLDSIHDRVIDLERQIPKSKPRPNIVSGGRGADDHPEF